MEVESVELHRQELQVNVMVVQVIQGQIKVNQVIAAAVVSLVIKMVISIGPIVQLDEVFKSDFSNLFHDNKFPASNVLLQQCYAIRRAHNEIIYLCFRYSLCLKFI